MSLYCSLVLLRLESMILLLFPLVLNSIAQSWPSKRPETFSYSRDTPRIRYAPQFSRFTPYMTEESLPKPIFGEIPTYLRDKIGPRSDITRSNFPNPDMEKPFSDRTNQYTYRNPYVDLPHDGPPHEESPFRESEPHDGPPHEDLDEEKPPQYSHENRDSESLEEPHEFHKPYKGPSSRESERPSYKGPSSRESERSSYKGPSSRESGERYHGPPKHSIEYESGERESEYRKPNEERKYEKGKFEGPSYTTKEPITSLERPETSRPYPSNPSTTSSKKSRPIVYPPDQQIPADKIKPGLLFDVKNSTSVSKIYNVTATPPFPYPDSTIRIRKISTSDPYSQLFETTKQEDNCHKTTYAPTSDPYSKMFETTIKEDNMHKTTYPPREYSSTPYVLPKYSPLEGPYPDKHKVTYGIQAPKSNQYGHQEGQYSSRSPHMPSSREEYVKEKQSMPDYRSSPRPQGHYPLKSAEYEDHRPRGPPRPSSPYIPRNQQNQKKSHEKQELRPPPRNEEQRDPQKDLDKLSGNEAEPKPSSPPPPQIPNAAKIFDQFNFGGSASLINDFFPELPKRSDEEEWTDDKKKEKRE